MQITIDNRDTENIHIDTYCMLRGDGYAEAELEYHSDEMKPGEFVTYDDFDWEYNHKQIVEDFAKASIEIIEQAISYTDYAKIITNIEYLASGSPKFYNYTTDGYTMAVTVDEQALAKYIDENHAAIVAIAETYGPSYEQPSLENMQHAAVCHILNNCITADDYNMAMWEEEYQVYSDNTTYTLITK